MLVWEIDHIFARTLHHVTVRMNLKAILVFWGSVISFAAEATSNHRKWLLTVLLILMFVSFIPILVSLTEFFSSPRSKWRRFKYALFQLLLDEYFPVTETRWRLEGRGIYCHQGYSTTVHCLHDSHLVVAPELHAPVIDIPTDTVKHLKLSFLNKATAYRFFRYTAEVSLRGISVLREYESEPGYTYELDVYLSDEAGIQFFRDLGNEHVLIELGIYVGDLYVFFRFDKDGKFVPTCAKNGTSQTSITFEIAGNPETMCIYKPKWGCREALRLLSYMAYWEQRHCCGVLLTSPYTSHFKLRTPTIVLNVCTVQDLIDVAESEAPLTRFRAIHPCITEGKYFWNREHSTASEIANLSAARRKSTARSSTAAACSAVFPCYIV